MHALTFQIVYRSISRFVSKFSSFGMIPRVSPILEKVPELLFDLPPIYVYHKGPTVITISLIELSG